MRSHKASVLSAKIPQAVTAQKAKSSSELDLEVISAQRLEEGQQTGIEVRRPLRGWGTR